MTAPNLTTPHGKSGPKNPKWGEERITRIKGYLADGLSYELIAQEMNTTRNGISGAVYRLGLSDKASPRRPSVSKRATTSAGRKRRKPTTEPRMKITPAFETTEAVEIAVDFVPPNPIRFVDSTDDTCKWPCSDPTSEMLVCGEPVRDQFGCPYCAAHSRVAYKPSAGPKPWVPGRVGV